MSNKRKALRYKQKHLDYQREASATLRMKVLRSVLAVGVGFALTPWLGRDAYAEGNANGNIVRTGASDNLIASGTAHIFAEKATANGVGLNSFEHFTVGNNGIANLYFKQKDSDAILNTLVNTVKERIDISGTVNAIRDGKIGGNLYFLSPRGMIVGSSGVINAGSLTVVTSGDTFSSADKAAQAIKDNSWSLDKTASVDIHGKINTATGIDLRAAYINVTKDQGASTAPILKTGVMFDTTVNTEGLVTDFGVKNERLTATADDKGNIIIADPNAPSSAELKGDGSIKLTAFSDTKNTNTKFLGVTSIDNTVEAKVEVGEGATVDAVGNVAITAEAKRLQRTKITQFWDMVAFTKAEATINGAVSGADVNISAKASSEYSGGNYANVFDILNDAGQETGVLELKSKLSNYLLGFIESNPHWGQPGMITNNIFNQLYMPFAITDAKATVNIGAPAQITAKMPRDSQGNPFTYTKDQKTFTVGGNIHVDATSTAKNKMKVAIQPHIKEGTADLSKYFTGGFIYQNSTSNAKVNVNGKLDAEQNMEIAAVAKNNNSGSMGVTTPKYYDQGEHGDKYASMFMVGVGLSYQDTEATVNLGTANLANKGTEENPLLKANGKLDVKAESTNDMECNVETGTDITAGKETDDTAVSTAVNLVNTKGTATINDYVAVRGGSVNMEAQHNLDSFSISTCDEYVGEFTGLSWVINTDAVAEKADSLKPLLKAIWLGNQMPDDPGAGGGGGGGGAAAGGAGVPSWNQYFDLGASVSVADVTNDATINLYPTSYTQASSTQATDGNLNISAGVEIGDTAFATTNLLINSNDTTYVTVAAAVAVENMHNTAEVNINQKTSNSQESSNAKLIADGDVSINSSVEQRYNRVNSMCEDVLDAWDKFKKHYTDWSKAGVKDKINKLESIIVDILWIREKEKTTSYKDSKKFGKKASAAIDLLGSLTGTNELREALLAFFDPANYVNMYVSAGGKNNDADKQKDVTGVLAGTVGVQNLHNTANVNIGANTVITGGSVSAVDIAANVVETNIMAAGKLNAFPYIIIDPTPIENAKTGIGGTVGVQNAYNNSKVKIMNGVTIDAGTIDIATKNDVLNIGIGIAGSQTSKLGLMGMVSYMGGESHAETLVDDDVSFTARKKVVHQQKEGSESEYEDKVESEGAVNITSTNKTDIINLVGEWSSSQVSSVGASVGVISYDIHSIAELTNQELKADGTSAEADAAIKGSISANSVKVNALTDGIINNLTVAGVKNSSDNANQQAGGVNVAAGGGAGAGGVQNAQVNGGNAGEQEATIKLNAVGSVSWNYVVDETKATLDNVKITLTPPEKGAGVTDTDVTGSVRVEAEDASYIGAYSGAMALNKLGNGDNSKFRGTLAGAVGVNDLKKTTTATLENSVIKKSTDDVGVDVLNYAHNSGAQVATGLSLGLEVGKRQSGIDINLAASGSANYIDSTVHGDMLNNTIVGGNTVVNNVAYDQDVQVAGGVTTQVTQATASAGAAVTVNDVKNDIKAAMKGNQIGSNNGGNVLRAAEVHNIAASKLTQVGTAISVGVATGKSYAALNVAVAKNSVDNTVGATIDGGAIYANKVSNEAKDGKLTANTADNKYLTELNQTSSFAVTVDANGNFVTGEGEQQQTLSKDITVGTDGNFYKNGELLTPSVEIEDDGYYQNGVKLKANVTKKADGKYYDINNREITLSEADGLYHDADGKIVDVEDVRYYNVNGQEVDVVNVVYTDTHGHIVDIYDITYKDGSGKEINNPNELKTTNKNFYDFTGNDALNQANGASADPTNTKGADLSVIVNDNADKATYNSSKITLSNQGNTIVGVALGLGVVAGQETGVSVAGAAAASVNTITNNFTAAVKNATIGTGASSYEASKLKEAALRVEAASYTSMVSVAAGVAANAKNQGVSIAAAGSGASQNITNTTKASVENSTIYTDNLAIKSTTDSRLVSVAGQVSVETSQKGVAAGLTWAENNMNNTTGAYAQGITLNGINGAETNLALAAENKAKTWAVAVGASVALGNGALEGAYAENSGKNNTEAIVDQYIVKNSEGKETGRINNTITNAKTISLTAKDTSVEKGIAGSVAVTAGDNAMASIGGAVVYNNIGNSKSDKQAVKAQLNNAAITTASGANIQTKATNGADFLGLALGGAVRAGGEKFGVSAEGSVAVTTDCMNTIAGMDYVEIDKSGGTKSSTVEVEATSTSKITSSADALSVSVGDGIKISGNAAVSKVRSDADTTTEIKNSIIKAQDVIAKANSTNEILDVAIGLSAAVGGGSASVALAGNVATNKIGNDTTVTFANDDIYATGTVAALSDSYERLRNYGGAISAGVSSQNAVALGATIVTNTIEGDTESIIKNSSIVALGDGDGVKLNEHSFGEIASGSPKYELKETAATSATAKKGLVVNAEAEHLLRDISITGGVAVGGSAGVAVDATVVINKIGGDTTAAVNNTDVNKNIANLSTADVTVDAYDRADISSHIGTLSVGVGAGEGAGVGAAGAGDRNTVNRTTTARILGKNDNSTVLNAHNVNVNSLGYTSVYLSESGLAAGASALAGAGVTGSVSVDRFTSNTTALVSQVKGTVNDLIVYADRLANVEAYNNAIALSGGIFSGSVSVGVTDMEDTSHTNAELSKVQIAAVSNQNGKVQVLADNHTQMATELSGDALAVSIGGAAGIAVGNINTEAQVGAKVDHAVIGTEEKEFGEFTVEANNNTYNRYQNIAVGAGSLLGVAVGKGAMNINTGTAAEVLNSSAFAKNINVNALEKRTIDTDMVGVGVGALNIGVNVMYTNIGTNLKSKYGYDDGSKSYDTREFQAMVNGALERMNSQVDTARAKTGDTSITRGSSSINTGRADQGGIRNTISNSALKASEDLKVQAKATTNTDIDIKQASIAIVNVGVPANRTDVEDKLTVDIDNAVLWGKSVAVSSITDGAIKSYTGQGGYNGASYVDTTAYVKHHGTNKITIDGSTLNVVNAASEALNPLLISAVNNTWIDNSALGVNIGGLAAGRMVLEGEDSAEVKVELGKDANVSKENVFSSTKLVDGKSVYAGVKAVAENAAVVKDEIKAHVGVSGVAVGGSIVTSKATGKATLDVSGKNAFAAQKVDLESLTGGTKNQYTTEAINRAVGVSALTINVDKSRTYNNMQASTTVGAIRIIDQVGDNKITPADLKIGATNATSSNAYIHSVGVGIGAASGSNFAQSHAEGKAITTVNAGDSGISANSFDIFASNSDDIVAKADGSNAGLMDISPYAARVENTVNTTTTVNLTGNFEAAEAFKAQALRSDTENFSADALSVTLAGGGDARVDSTITANTNVNVSGAIINSGDDTILEAENTVEMNRKDGYAEMVKGQGYAVFGVNTSGIGNTINSTAHVNLLNSELQSGGNLKAIAHTEEQLQVNDYVYTASALGGVESRVTNNITNDEEIKVQNSSLKTTEVYNDITLAAADDLKLFTYAYSEFSTGAFGGADSIVTNNLTRNNRINLISGSDLYSLQDTNLYAGKNADGSVATLDLDAEASDFVGAIIPITLKPTVTNNIQQNNQITVDASSASTSVRHTNLYASTGREMARTTSGRYVGFYDTSRDSKFVTTDKGETIDGKNTNNFVNINGKVVAGIANKIDITIGTAGDIVILDQIMRSSVSGAKDASQITIKVDANESTGLTKDSLTFGSENYANTLYNRYNAVLDLMNEYEKDGNDSAVYLGYKAEGERILEEMLTLGLAERVLAKDSNPQNPTYIIEPKASLIVDYVEIPALVGSGGNIVVDTDVLKSTSGSGVAKAQGTPEIKITNNTNLMTKVNSITVGDPGGKLIFNGTNVSGTNTEAFNQNIGALNKESAQVGFKNVEAADGQSGKVEIQGLYNGNSLNYSFKDNGQRYTGSYRPMANIQVQGNIYSKEGEVTIKSAHDSILVQGKTVKDAVSVSGSTVNIIAENGSITQGYTDGIVSIGGDVRQQYNAQYREIIQNSVGQYTLSYVDTSIADGSKGSGSYIAGGSVYINASDININGVIQSGFGDYYADISGEAVQNRITQINDAYNGKAISDSVVTTGEQYKIIDGGAYWDAQTGCYKYKLNVYYNPSTQKILVQNVDAGGGKVYLTGRISSTGNGKIICLDGVSNITVNNSVNYDLQVGDLITHEVAGLVSITDTAQGKLTEITNGKVTVKDILAGGKISSAETSNDFTGSYNYAPQTGLRYTWTTGKEVTTFNRYSKDFKEGGWGMWDNGVDTEKLAQWTTTNNVQPIQTGLENNKDRAPGETIRLDTTAGNNSFVTVTHENVTNKIVKESERKFSTGLWGINKHYEVTWTRTTGDLYTYDASVKADNPINIKFIGTAAADANINVTSVKDIELTGTVGNTELYETKVNNIVTGRNEKGSVNITSTNGSIIQSGGALYGANITLSAAKDMKNITIVAGDVVNLSATNTMANQNAIAQNSMDLTVNAAYLAKGNVVLGNMGSVVSDESSSYIPVNTNNQKTTGVTGLVKITTTGSEGNISQNTGSLIVSDRIDLNTNNGSIYGQKNSDGSVTALNLYAGQQPIGLDTLDASVNASAKGDINLKQVDGNMRIGRIYATEGDVTLTVAHGSVEDALPYVSSDRGDADDMVQRWRELGIVAEGDSNMISSKSSLRTDAIARFNAYLTLKNKIDRTEEEQASFEKFQAKFGAYDDNGTFKTDDYLKNQLLDNYTANVQANYATMQKLADLETQGSLTEEQQVQYAKLQSQYAGFASAESYLQDSTVAQETKTRINSQSNIGAYEAWDTYALLYAIQDSIVNPETSALPSTSDKDPNIIGHNITINVADSVGMNSGIEKRIDTATLLDKDTSGNYENLDDLKSLSKLDASTKVTWETGDNGHTYAVYTETIPLGIQQTVQKDASGKDVYGKLTIQTAANSTNLNGDIFLQGREQKLDANGLASAITNNKNIYINNICTTIGEITVTSLGGIYNAANAAVPTITGRNLVITAAGGSIGTKDAHITINLFGADKAVDGLSAIAAGGIYVDQKGASDLIVRNASSGGDIFLGSDKSILMGVVNGADADSYIRAENNGDITLEARGGSIGEAAYEADSQTISRESNKGVRILNAAAKSASATDPKVTNVTLLAQDNVYVTGIASETGKTAVGQGPAGWLNLSIASNNVDSNNQPVQLQNVGICVDGQLNLYNAIDTSATASVYVTDNLALNNDITVKSLDTFVGSAKALTINVASGVEGTNKLTLKAGNDLLMNQGSLTGNVIELAAGKDISLQSGTIAASTKAVLEADGNILLKGGSMTAPDVDMLALGYVDQTYDNSKATVNGYELSVSNTLQVMTGGKYTADGQDYGIDLGSKFNQLQKVEMNSENGNVVLGNGGSKELGVSVQTIQGVDTVNGSIQIHNYDNGTKNNVKISNSLKATEKITIINDNGDIINSGIALSGSDVALNAFAGDVYNFAGITATNGGVDIYAAKNVYNIGDAVADCITATDTVSIVAGSATHGADEGLVWNTAKIHSDTDVVIQATDRVVNTVDIPDGMSLGQSTQSGAISANGTVKITTIHKSDSTSASFGIYNSASISAGENAIINSRDDLINTGNIQANGYIDLDATEEVINGAENAVTGQIKAGGNIYLTSWKGNVTNYDNIQSTAGQVVLENGFVYTLSDNNDTGLVNNILNTGSIVAQEDVLIRTYNGNIENKNIITSYAGSVLMEALQSEQYLPDPVNHVIVGELKNTDTDNATSNADITANKGITLNAATIIDNSGDFLVTGTGDIIVKAGDLVTNSGNYRINGAGKIAVTATGLTTTVGSEQVTTGGDILNYGNYYTKSGNITIESNEDVLNTGVMETESGNSNISIISVDGVVFNKYGADLLSGNGNVSLQAQSNDGYYYYFDAEGNLNKVPAGITPVPAGDGTYTAVIDGVARIVLKNGSVFNAGDAMAIDGTITMSSAYGDVTNYDDFNTLVSTDGADESSVYRTTSNPNGIAIATGNVEILAKNGTLYNNKNLESGENITLIAAEGLSNFAYNIYAGKNITLKATSGDVVNSATLESYAGNVTLQAMQGNIINGVQNDFTVGKGDIITYGGNVTLLAQGKDNNGVGFNVTNYGDIIATNTNAVDKENTGSILLKSEHGNVHNFDDFNTYDNNGVYMKYYDADLHTSIDSTSASYNIANNNLTISAVNGNVYNSKDYLVALGDVTLEAKTGLGSFGQVIYAGKNITLNATKGDLFNKAEMLSVEGDITLKAEKGTVVNLVGGDLIAKNGNVTLEAGAGASNTIRVVDSIGNSKELAELAPADVSRIQAAGDNILITKQYYKDTDRAWVEIVKTNDMEVVIPDAATAFKTEIFYLDASERNAEKPVTTIEGTRTTGLLEAYRTGDVVNRGDIIAQGSAEEDKGAVTLHSAMGNTTNYDNFKLYNNQNTYDYRGQTGKTITVGGSTESIQVHFNADTPYYYDSLNILLSDSDMNLIADEGYLYNNMNIVSHKDVNLTSGKTLTIGTNVSAVIADGNVVVRSTGANVINDGTVVSNNGSIILDGYKGVDSQQSADHLKALNGSISAVSIYGDVNVKELVAGDMAAAGSQKGNVVLGKVDGKDVVLYTENASSQITVGESLKVDEHLLLQGNNFAIPTIDRSDNKGTLIVDVTGVGADGSGAAMQSDLNLTIAGDVLFTTLNVTNAEVNIGGKMEIDKLHVSGEAHFYNQGYVTGVYGGGVAPEHDSSNALYYDLGEGSSGYKLRATADEFRAIKEGEPEEVRALNTMRQLRQSLQDTKGAAGFVGSTGGNGGWMNLYVENAKYQSSNGLLLHIDTGYRSANQRWSAEDLSAKLNDYKPVQSYEEHYGDAVGIFGRYDLLEATERPVAEILHSANSNKVALHKDNDGLRIETQQENEQEEKKKEA